MLDGLLLLRRDSIESKRRSFEDNKKSVQRKKKFRRNKLNSGFIKLDGFQWTHQNCSLNWRARFLGFRSFYDPHDVVGDRSSSKTCQKKVFFHFKSQHFVFLCTSSFLRSMILHDVDLVAPWIRFRFSVFKNRFCSHLESRVGKTLASCSVQAKCNTKKNSFCADSEYLQPPIDVRR